MSPLKLFTLAALTLSGLCLLATPARADIYRWDNGEVIPGTEGIEPGPGVQLDHRELDYAALYGLDLTDSRFDFSNLSNAYLYQSTLTNANLTGANLTSASLYQSTLTNANLAGAVVTGADFGDTTSRGFTQAQLGSTASFQTKNLQGIGLEYNDLTDWDLSGQNLTGVYLDSSTLANAHLTGANLTRARLDSSVLTNADLTGAVVTGAFFGDTTSRGFTQAQLASTASYQTKNLQGIVLQDNDLTGWDLSGQNLTSASLYQSTLTNANLTGANLTNAYLNSTLTNANLTGANLTSANLYQSTLTNANLTGAVVTGAFFGDTTSRGFTQAQLASTASYQTKNLQGIGLSSNDLTGWDLSGQNLTSANLYQSTLTNANLTGANLTLALLSQSTLTNAHLTGANLTDASLVRSTLTNANLTGANLTNANLYESTLTNANLTGANLTGARLDSSVLTNADLTGAVVTGAFFGDTTSRGLTQAQLASTASYQTKNLQGIGLSSNDLTGWDLSGQNLASASLYQSTLTNANLTGANLTSAQLHQLTLTNANLTGANLTSAQLSQSTLTNANLTGANLTNAYLVQSTLTNANLTGADTRGAQGLDLSGATSRNAILEYGVIAGVDLASGDELVVRNYHGDPDGGLGPISITVQSHLTMGGDGALQILFDADPWDSLISFQPGIPVQLGGSLELAFVDDVDASAQAGRTLHIFDWTGVALTGAFTVDSDYLWDVSNLYTSGEVRLVSALSGDTNGDGQVGLEDLNAVRNNFGIAGEPGLPGDAIPFDGVVDLDDLNAVRNNIGAKQSSQASVPEPSGWALILIGVTLIAFRQSRAIRLVAAHAGVLLLASTSVRADIYRWDTGELIPGTEGIEPGPGVQLDHRELAYARLSELNLTNSRFDFSNLTRAYLMSTTLTYANLSGANLTNAYLYSSTLTDANLSGAIVNGTSFESTTSRGFTRSQLESTASYQAKGLQGIGLAYNDLTGWDFREQNLTNAYLYSSTLLDANLTAADMRGALDLDLTGATSNNAILPDGTIAGLNLAAGDQLVIRDDDGVADRPLAWWMWPRQPISITAQDHFEVSDGGVLRLSLEADLWDSLISFEPDIPVELSGTLELTFADGVDASAQAGRTLHIFDWTGVAPTGAFTVDSDFLWGLTNLYTSGEITLLSALTGDTNGDGQVGLEDLNNVRNHFGESGAPGLPGDAIPFDGIVDIADLNAVRNNFGATQVGFSSVSEPRGFAIGAVALLGVILRSVARRRTR